MAQAVADSTPVLAAPASADGRLYELDLLRFVAAAAVVIFHLGFIGSAATGPQPSNLLAPVAKYGYLGVDFFFILSGFVIARSANGAAARSANGRGALAFARARLVRLLPAYVAAIAATSTVLASVGDAPTVTRIAANLTFTQRIFAESFIDGAYWSLLVELRFYALIAVLIAVRLVSQLERVAYVWLAAVLGLRLFGGPAWIDTIVITPFAHLFIAGIVLSALSADRAVTKPRIIATTLCLAVGLSQAMGHAETLSNATRRYSPTVAALSTIVFFALFVVIAMRGIPSLRRPVFAALGAASYPLYLLHQEIGYRVYDAWDGRFWVMFPTILVAISVASHLIASNIEAPFAAWVKARKTR